MQAVGELHHDDADILDHRQHHLAEVFRLRLGLAFELDQGQLADAVDQLGDLFAELADHHLLRGAGVLDNVVQNAGDNALRIHVHAGKDARHFDGVIDIRFA